jgi:signal transduction histidine kinase
MSRRAPSHRIVHAAIAVAALLVVVGIVQVMRFRRAQRDEMHAAMQEEMLGTARLLTETVESRRSYTAFLLFAPVHGRVTASQAPLRTSELATFVESRLQALGLAGDPGFGVFRLDSAGALGIVDGRGIVQRPEVNDAIRTALRAPHAGWRSLTAGIFRTELTAEGKRLVVMLSPDQRAGGGVFFGITHSADHWNRLLLRDVAEHASVFPATFYGVDWERHERSHAQARNLDRPLRGATDSVWTRSGRPFLVRLESPRGDVVYQSEGASADAWDSPYSAVLTRVDGSRLRVGVPVEVGARVLDVALPSSPGTWLLGGFIALGALFLAGVLLELRRRQHVAESQRRLGTELSHEVRTPLAHIATLSETLMLGGAESPEQMQRWLRTIHREAHRLAHLASTVLAHERREPHQPAQAEDIDLHELASEIAESAESMARARTARVALDIPPSFIVRADPGALRQILLNLVHNALEHGPEAQTIAITATREARRVVLTVDDEGPGIPAEAREEIWRPFRRLGEETDASRGSGLGLSIVRSLVERQGGKVAASEAPGGGARFVVTLPT